MRAQVAAIADAPLNGDYKSPDLGGPIDVGRYTEGWEVGGSATMPGSCTAGAPAGAWWDMFSIDAVDQLVRGSDAGAVLGGH